jgi:hypothetical protein
MPQDRESGAMAVEYGLETAKKIAEKLGGEKIGRTRSNEYIIDGENVVIKCARSTTNSVGVPYHMLDRLAAIIGAFETENGTYDLHKMKPDVYRGNMRPTRSTGPSAGRVGIVRKSAFLEQGSFMINIEIE